MELSGERCRGEEVRIRLEGELKEVRERLREKTEKLTSSEDSLLASRQKAYMQVSTQHTFNPIFP